MYRDVHELMSIDAVLGTGRICVEYTCMHICLAAMYVLYHGKRHRVHDSLDVTLDEQAS